MRLEVGLEGLAESWRYELAAFGIDSALLEPGVFSTEVYGRALAPDDSQRLTTYRDFDAVMAPIRQGIQAALSRPGCGDPQQFAEAVMALIALPKFERPFQTLVGSTSSLRTVN